MQLSHWLKQSKRTRVDFARAVEISPGRVTQLCEGDLPSLDLAERIAKVTSGAVMPNDFVGLLPSQQWINRVMTDTQARVTAAVEAFARGEIVVVTDDDDRENEGDLVMAAVHATPEKMAFIIRNTCGIVCTPLPAETAHRLRLAPMVAENDAPHGTAFTVTVDYKHGTTTGISAEDRVAKPRTGCASRRWSPRTTRRTAPPSPSRSITSTAPPRGSRRRIASRNRAPAAPRADGRRERRAARHRLHRHGRLQARHHHGDLGGGSRRETAHRLRLAPMVAENDAPHGTAFTVTVDYKHGTTTGISAEDRV